MSPLAKPLRFRGAPIRLTATSVEVGQPPKSGLAFFPGAAPSPLQIRTLRATTPTVTLLSFRLPRTTKPGHYDGTMELGGAPMPIKIEVQARPQMRFYPAWLSLAAHPDERLEINVGAVNLGNVDVPIERRPRSAFSSPGAWMLPFTTRSPKSLRPISEGSIAQQRKLPGRTAAWSVPRCAKVRESCRQASFGNSWSSYISATGYGRDAVTTAPGFWANPVWESRLKA